MTCFSHPIYSHATIEPPSKLIVTVTSYNFPRTALLIKILTELRLLRGASSWRASSGCVQGFRVNRWAICNRCSLLVRNPRGWQQRMGQQETQLVLSSPPCSPGRPITTIHQTTTHLWKPENFYLARNTW